MNDYQQLELFDTSMYKSLPALDGANQELINLPIAEEASVKSSSMRFTFNFGLEKTETKIDLSIDFEEAA